MMPAPECDMWDTERHKKQICSLCRFCLCVFITRGSVEGLYAAAVYHESLAANP